MKVAGTAGATEQEEGRWQRLGFASRATAVLDVSAASVNASYTA
jgi:hypothetical protein